MPTKRRYVDNVELNLKSECVMTIKFVHKRSIFNMHITIKDQHTDWCKWGKVSLHIGWVSKVLTTSWRCMYVCVVYVSVYD